MKLVTFTHQGATRIGIIVQDAVIDLSMAAPEIPREMTAFLAAGSAAMDRAGSALNGTKHRIRLAQVKLEAPILAPPEFLAAGVNYADHVREVGMEMPKYPVFFNKQSTCVNGPYDPIHLPRVSQALDYEGELGFVIGRRCRHVPRERAREVIAGYLVVNDVSVRDWQFRTPTVTIGKSFDTHGPIGPWILTADEVPDPHVLDLRTLVNGEVRQHSNTKHLIFDCFALIETLSTAFTLKPGMIISTGTPSGVGIGFKPPRFLRAGDVVRIEIEGIGHLENRVVDEPANTACI